MTNVSEFLILSCDPILMGEKEGGKMLVEVPKREKTWGNLTCFPTLYMEYSRNSEHWFGELESLPSEAKVVQRYRDSKSVEFLVVLKKLSLHWGSTGLLHNTVFWSGN